MLTKNTTNKNIPSLIYRAIKIVAVPHVANQYRPHAIRLSGLLIAFIMIASLLTGNAVSYASNVLDKNETASTQQLLRDTNTVREKQGLSSLQLNQLLSKAAYSKATDMFTNQYWAHESPSGVQPWQWIDNTGYKYTNAGENLAKGFQTSSAVSAAWLASPEHRDNILGDYSDVGFAVVDGELKGEHTTLVVALYGLPVAPVVASSVTTFSSSHSAGGVLTLIQQKLRALPVLVLISIGIVGLLVCIAFTTYLYGSRRPSSLKQRWYRHHGAYKAASLMMFGGIIIIMYSGGQI